MSGTRRASSNGSCPPNEELRSFDFGGIVDYLKQGPPSFDLNQNNDIFCDPINGTESLVELDLCCLSDDRTNIIQYPRMITKTFCQRLLVTLIQQRIQTMQDNR